MTSTTARAEQIAAFYARHADRLHRIVARNVNASEQTIEDACQNAWAILLRCDDITLDDRAAAWLATVAIREGWRLTRGERDVPMGAMLPGVPEPGELPEPEAPESTADAQAIARIEHAERVADLRTLRRAASRPVPAGARLQLRRDLRSDGVVVYGEQGAREGSRTHPARACAVFRTSQRAGEIGPRA